jgi:hypothetical protein
MKSSAGYTMWLLMLIIVFSIPSQVLSFSVDPRVPMPSTTPELVQYASLTIPATVRPSPLLNDGVNRYMDQLDKLTERIEVLESAKHREDEYQKYSAIAWCVGALAGIWWSTSQRP